MDEKVFVLKSTSPECNIVIFYLYLHSISFSSFYLLYYIQIKMSVDSIYLEKEIRANTSPSVMKDMNL